MSLSRRVKRRKELLQLLLYFLTRDFRYTSDTRQGLLHQIPMQTFEVRRRSAWWTRDTQWRRRECGHRSTFSAVRNLSRLTTSCRAATHHSEISTQLVLMTTTEGCDPLMRHDKEKLRNHELWRDVDWHARNDSDGFSQKLIFFYDRDLAESVRNSGIPCTSSSIWRVVQVSLPSRGRPIWQFRSWSRTRISSILSNSCVLRVYFVSDAGRWPSSVTEERALCVWLSSPARQISDLDTERRQQSIQEESQPSRQSRKTGVAAFIRYSELTRIPYRQSVELLRQSLVRPQMSTDTSDFEMIVWRGTDLWRQCLLFKTW